ncbi:GL19604 [Drosophila persimilis]|uniref:GL19604 n=2 Tax=Drosophila persimilis TaxID=7234 RepID=B4G7C2_DROPE|nr:GL19604 [Drosophila persimilis]
MLINRAVVNRLNSQCGMATGLMCRKKPQVLSDGVVVASIKMQNLGKVRLDSRRSFVTSQMLLEKEHPFVPKKPETKGQTSPEATADTEGTQAPTASDGDGPSDSTTKFSMSRLANSLLSRNQSGQALNIHDLGTANMEFRRSFMTSQKLLEKEFPFVPKKPETKGQTSPEDTADAEGTQAPTASDGDGPSDSTTKFSMSRLANSLLSRNQSGQALNIHDLGTANMEFRRSFMTSQKLLEKEFPFVPKKPETKGQTSPEDTADAEGTQAPTASDGEGPSDSTTKFTSVLDVEANLLKLRNKILVHRATMSRLATSLLSRKQSDLQLRRSFLTSQTLLEKEFPFVPKKPETKGQTSPEDTADAEGTQAPTASDGEGPSDSTTKFTSVLDVEANLLKLRNKILVHRATMSRLATSLLSRKQSDQADLQLRRSFLTSQTLLEKEHPFVPKNPVTTEDAKGQSSPEATADAEGTQAPTASDGDGPSFTSSVVDLDGNPIQPIEIDAWNQDGESDPTVQNSTHVDIGDDDEYNAEMALKVPKTREAEFSYKGITVKLPESASQDMGTYRFRRDTEDLETLADDMRIIKFDKK